MHYFFFYLKIFGLIYFYLYLCTIINLILLLCSMIASIKKIGILFALIFVSSLTQAQTFHREGDVLYYQYTNDNQNSLTVCASPDNSVKYAGNIIIPEVATITDADKERVLSVVAIAEGAFEYATDLVSITIPASVTSIGTNAFNGCNSDYFTKAVFASNDAFCKTVFNGPKSNPLYYTHHLFYKDSNDEITAINIPQELTAIGKGAFAGGYNITNIIISENITAVGEDAFLGCNNLTVKFNHEEQLKTIEYGNDESRLLAKASQIFVNNDLVKELSFNQNIPNGYYKKATWLKKVTFGYGVDSIGKQAFEECSALNTINFETTSVVSTILEKAFNNSSLSTIQIAGQNTTNNTLPTSIIKIGNQAFRNCNFTSITIPQNVSTIDNEAFMGCTKLETANIQATITTLPNGLFNGCNKLSQVQLASTIKIIGERAFYRCTTLTSIPSNGKITTIRQEAFSGCDGFKTLELPSTIDNIGTQAFAYCQNLTDLFIPERTDPETGLAIGSQAFLSNNSSLKRIYAKMAKAPIADEEAFKGNQTITLFIPSGSGVSGYYEVPWIYFNPTPSSEHTITFVINNEEYKQESVQVGLLIADYLSDPMFTDSNPWDGWTFSGWQFSEGDIPELMPDNDIVLYGYYTTNKTNVINYALRSDTRKATIIENNNIEVSNVTIGQYVNIDNVDYQIVAIVDEAFKGAENLVHIDLSAATSLNTIGKSVFADCTNLEEVKLPSHTTKIVDKMFYNCRSLSEIDIPNSITQIGTNAFAECINLNSVSLPSNIAELGEKAFYNSGIISITLPKSINTIGNSVFSKSTSLQTVIFEKEMNLTVLPEKTFQGCSELKNISFPASLRTIAASAFEQCNKLQYLIFDDDAVLEAISTNAFNLCGSLKAITLPATINSIGGNAFGSCNNIQTITIHNQEPPSAGSSSFSSETISKASLYVPDSYAYGQHPFWSQFRIEAIGDAHTLTYLVDGKQYGEVQTLKVGTRIAPQSAPANPDNREYQGWIGEPDIMPNEDVVVEWKFKYHLTYQTETSQETLHAVDLFYGATVQEPVEKLKRSEYRYDIIDNIQTMPSEDVVLVVKYTKTEQDYIPGTNNPYALRYHIYTDGDNQHAELMPGETPYSATDLEVPASIHYEDEFMSADYPVTVIRANAFKSCSSLTQISIPKSVKSIGKEVFMYCNQLKEVFFIDENHESELSTLPAYTFSDCSKLETVDLPMSLKTIENNVFRNCNSLKEIVIPANVESIGNYAFEYCKNLKEITLESLSILPNAHETSFDEKVYELCKINLHEDVYKQWTAPWNKWDTGNINILEGTILTQKCSKPKIYYDKGTLKFACEAGAVIKYEIAVTDALKTEGTGTEASPLAQVLNKTYVITAYASAVGKRRSDPAIATIIWQNGLPTLTDFDDVTPESTEQQGIPGDKNGDGQVTAEDAALILKELVGKTDTNQQ